MFSYPVGHYVRLTDNFGDPRSYYGLIKCSMLPPDNLFLPILPVRVNGKLVFALCTACSRDVAQAPCLHSDKERMIHGTWCTPEVHAAMDRGYVMHKIDEVWHYEKKQAGLFASYVDEFLKIKTEASGWPNNVSTDEEKRAFIADFERAEGIRLDYNNICPNPGLRALAKLCLNRQERTLNDSEHTSHYNSL